MATDVLSEAQDEFENWMRVTLEEADKNKWVGPTPDEIARAWASALWNAHMRRRVVRD